MRSKKFLAISSVKIKVVWLKIESSGRGDRRGRSALTINSETSSLTVPSILSVRFIYVYLEMKIDPLELKAMREKTNRHLRLRELLMDHSRMANLVVMTLPIPRRSGISTPLYMAWLECLTRDMPPFILIRGNQESVLTYYS